MRKLKDNTLKKIKPKTNKEIEDNLDLYFGMNLFSHFLSSAYNFFRIERQVKENPKIKNNYKLLNFKIKRVIDPEYFKKEISLFKQMFLFLAKFDRLKTEEQKSLFFAIAKNDRLKNATTLYIKTIIANYQMLIAGTLDDINDEYVMRDINNMLAMYAALNGIKNCFDSIKREELLEYFTEKELKTIKTICTKGLKLVAYTLSKFTGRETEYTPKLIEIRYEAMKEVLGIKGLNKLKNKIRN